MMEDSQVRSLKEEGGGVDNSLQSHNKRFIIGRSAGKLRFMGMLELPGLAR